MKDLIGMRQRYLLIEREENRVRKERAKKKMNIVWNCICALAGIALCAGWFFLYWFVCP